MCKPLMFKPELADLVQRGLKTQTRRLRHSDDRVTYDETGKLITRVQRADKRGRLYTVYEVGKTAPVMTNYTDGVLFYIRYNLIRSEPWKWISPTDAKAEGFPDREAFLEYVTDLYPSPARRPDLSAACWALTIELIKESLPCLS